MTPFLPSEPTRWVPREGAVRLATYARGVGEAGDPPVVMINGLGASAHDWGPILEILAAGHRLITFDNRGSGRSRVPDRPMTLDRLVSDTVAVIDAYGQEPVDLVGYSMGGMIAQLVAAAHPEQVRRLVLMSTHAGARSAVPSASEARAVLSPEGEMPRAERVRMRFEAFVAPDFLERKRETFEEMLSTRVSHLGPRYAWRRQLRAVMESERTDLVREIRAPTLIVHGEDDPLIPVRNGRMLADLIPGARLVIVAGCGHMLHWEAGDEVASVVIPFLS